jgi:hypothetical protein
MEPEVSLPRSQEPTTSPYPEHVSNLLVYLVVLCYVMEHEGINVYSKLEIFAEEVGWSD